MRAHHFVLPLGKLQSLLQLNLGTVSIAILVKLGRDHKMQNALVVVRLPDVLLLQRGY
jgi:hypothetical protein